MLTMINTWYVAAILFGAVAAFCAYRGSIVEGNRSSEEQTSRIETQLQQLGTELQGLRHTADSPAQVARVEEADKKYQELAETFFQVAPLRSAQEDERTARQRVEEVQKTQEIEAYFSAVNREVEMLAAAYNQSAGRTIIEIESSGVPENLFMPSQDHPGYVLLSFSGQRYWGVRIVFYPNRALALQFVRLISPDGSSDYKRMQLSNDSINMVLMDGTFSVSLNQSISDAVRANVTDGISLERQDQEQFLPIAVDLARRVIEYELLLLRRTE